MHLFASPLGAILVSIGFDMLERKSDPYMISWSSAQGTEWEPTAHNGAGSRTFPFKLEPEFIRNTKDGFVLYQPGLLIEATFLGLPMAWGFKAYKPGGEEPECIVRHTELDRDGAH